MIKWSLRYFNNKPRNRFQLSDEHEKKQIAFSNSMYDKHKGISHFLQRYTDNTDVVRFCGDVEISMSTDPSVTSLFSREHRTMLKSQLQSQVRSQQDGQPTDSDLLRNGAIPINLERDERVTLIKANASALDNTMTNITLRSEAQSPKVNPKPDNT